MSPRRFKMKCFYWGLLLLLWAGKPLAAVSLSPATAALIEQAQQWQTHRPEDAIVLLSEHKALEAYDRAYIAYTLGFLYWQEQQFTASGLQLEKALAAGLLSAELEWQAQRILAEVKYQQQDYPMALVLYKSLNRQADLHAPAEHPALVLRLALSYYQLQQWNQCLVVLNDYQRRWPKLDEQALRLRLAAQLQLKQYLAAIRSTEALLDLDPLALEWWRQLTALNLQLHRPDSALANLHLAQRSGLALPSDLQSLQAQLYAQLGLAKQAAKAYAKLHQQQADPTLLLKEVQQWQVAREWDKALALWPTVIASLPEHSADYVQLLLQEQQANTALAVLKRIPEQLSDSRLLTLTMQSHLLLDDKVAALHFAQLAHKHQPSDETEAWLHYLTAK